MTFRIASGPGDYNSCHRLMRQEGFIQSKLGFPTVMAIEGNDLVGFLGTKIEKKMIIAGPLVLKSDRRRIFTALRLAEAYEMSMRSMGIKSFIFYGEAGGLLDRAIKRYYPGMTPYAIRDNNAFYIWRAVDGRRSERSWALSRGEESSGSAGGTSRSTETDDREAKRTESGPVALPSSARGIQRHP